MKRKSLITIVLATIIVTGTILFTNLNENNKIKKLREQHQTFLDNSPFKETQGLSRSERKDLGLPPNAYNEQMWELMMDPSTGRPMPERVAELQYQLREQRAFNRGVGGESANPWIDRGPNNQGGRTRGIMFDPNDVGSGNNGDGVDYNRVFAGGVSGGLWVNDDITDANSSWTLVSGIQANISVTVIISDPNNSNIFYIGSGESYTSGSAVGRGVWRSMDGGVTWTNVFGGFTGVSGGGQNVDGIFYVNDIIARNNNGSTELYAAIAGALYSSSAQFNGLNEMGLYKSTDNGNNWNRFNIRHGDNSFKNPNDIELDINNNIWFTTTSNSFGNAGGDIYKSTNGITFSLIRNIPGANRTELEPSAIDANRFWIAANMGGGGPVDLFTTTDAFVMPANFTNMNEPNDADNGIPATDYTRNQAFYDLLIESDVNGKVYVGGVDLFTTANNGAIWTQISKWSNNPGLGSLNVPFMHADQHAMVFRSGTNGTEAVFGNDGGIYYSDDVNAANGNANAIQERNKDYNTVQFYSGAIDPTGEAGGDDVAGGTQDNGTQFVINAAAGANGYFDPVGGDGGFTEIDDSGQYAITTYPGNNSIYLNYPNFTTGFAITNLGGGSFINQAELDKNLDILYSNASSGGTNAIERVTEFLPGGAVQTNTLLTSGVMNSRPTALKISPYTTGSSALFIGLRNSKLIKVNFANFAPIYTDISGSSFVGSISDIEFGENEQEIFITMHNYGVVSVWFTSNGGTNWTNIEGNLPDLPVKCILQNPLIPEELIIGTELGVWATPDYTIPSPVWIQAYNGMSDVTVVDLDLRASDNTILATTHGRGMFTSQFTSTPLSVLESEINTNSILVYPTVSNGNISISSTANLGKSKVEIYNINGQKVYNNTIDLNGIENNLSLKFNSGLYFVHINGDNFSVTKRIIIK